MNRIYETSLGLARARALALADSLDRASGDREPAFSVINALDTLMDNPYAGQGAGTTPESRASARIAARMGRPPAPGTMFVPVQTRDATVAGTGGYLVGDVVAPGDVFTGALRANSIASALGVREVRMGRWNASFPRVANDVQTYWLNDEGTQVTEGDLVFGQGAAAPKTLGAYFEMSRQITQEMSPEAEQFVLGEAGKAMAAARDVALINGAGSSGEPTGILGTSGIGTESGGTLTWATTVSAINDVEAANALIEDGRGAWAVAPDAAEVMRARAKATGLGFIMGDGKIDGRPAIVSNSVPSAIALFGNWSQVVIASWGALEIGIAKASAGSHLFKTGMVGVRCLWTVDIVVLQPASFSKITGIS